MVIVDGFQLTGKMQLNARNSWHARMPPLLIMLLALPMEPIVLLMELNVSRRVLVLPTLLPLLVTLEVQMEFANSPQVLLAD